MCVFLNFKRAKLWLWWRLQGRRSRGARWRNSNKGRSQIRAEGGKLVFAPRLKACTATKLAAAGHIFESGRRRRVALARLVLYHIIHNGGGANQPHKPDTDPQPSSPLAMETMHARVVGLLKRTAC